MQRRRQLRFLILSFSVSLWGATAAYGSECELQSESFDPSLLALDAKTYKSDLKSCQLSGGVAVIGLRSFELSHKPYDWVIDQERLVTGIVKHECLQDCVALGDNMHPASAYERALTRTTAAPQPLQDGGIKRSSSMQLQMYVTADLCPSEKPLVREVFERMITLAMSGHLAVPIALSVSGGWLQKHGDDLEYLKNQEKNGRLQITWVNHTFTHPYDPELPLAHNFILKSGVDFTREILENEKLMFKMGLVPSVFVRLPGLISDQAHMTQLRKWGLIPLGADAWIAKGQSPHNGSIILIHANGNEPKGIRMFDQLLSEHGWWVNIFRNLPHALLSLTPPPTDQPVVSRDDP